MMLKASRRRCLLAIVALLTLAMPVQGRAVPGERHVVTGAARLDDGSMFAIDAQSVPPYVVGTAVLWSAAPMHLTEITIDCLEVSWHQPVYPIPPYLPFNMAEASGLDDTGTRHFITAYDLVPVPIGFGDRVVIETAPGDGACGASDSIGTPVVGDIAIAP